MDQQKHVQGGFADVKRGARHKQGRRVNFTSRHVKGRLNNPKHARPDRATTISQPHTA